MRRTGNQTKYDAVEGFDMYVESITDIITHTDDIQSLRALSDQIRSRADPEEIRKRKEEIRRGERGKNLTDEEKRAAIEHYDEKGGTALSNFVVELEEYTTCWPTSAPAGTGARRATWDGGSTTWPRPWRAGWPPIWWP